MVFRNLEDYNANREPSYPLDAPCKPMAILKIPTPLRSYTNGQLEVVVVGTNVGAAMEYLVSEYPTLRQHLYNADGKLRPFVNLFVGENNVKDLQGLDTPLDENTRVLLLPSIAGG